MPTSTVALQAPTAYGTSTNPADIFVDWNVPIATTTPDDPWHFGGAWQYPVLQYGNLDPAKQRPTVRLKLELPATSDKGGETATVTHQGDAWTGRPRSSPRRVTISAITCY